MCQDYYTAGLATRNQGGRLATGSERGTFVWGVKKKIGEMFTYSGAATGQTLGENHWQETKKF